MVKMLWKYFYTIALLNKQTSPPVSPHRWQDQDEINIFLFITWYNILTIQSHTGKECLLRQNLYSQGSQRENWTFGVAVANLTFNLKLYWNSIKSIGWISLFIGAIKSGVFFVIENRLPHRSLRFFAKFKYQYQNVWPDNSSCNKMENL